MKENVLRKKSLTFAVRIVNLSKYLRENKKEFKLSDQVLRSGTAIGAMVYEAERAESTPDFIHKMKVAEKEANETLYWLELLKETQYITRVEHDSMNNDTIELIKMLVSSIKTVRTNYKQQNA